MRGLCATYAQLMAKRRDWQRSGFDSARLYQMDQMLTGRLTFVSMCPVPQTSSQNGAARPCHLHTPRQPTLGQGLSEGPTRLGEICFKGGTSLDPQNPAPQRSPTLGLSQYHICMLPLPEGTLPTVLRTRAPAAMSAQL